MSANRKETKKRLFPDLQKVHPVSFFSTFSRGVKKRPQKRQKTPQKPKTAFKTETNRSKVAEKPKIQLSELAILTSLGVGPMACNV
jgi:hypothetical protein